MSGKRRTVADFLAEDAGLREYRAKTQLKALREQVEQQNRQIEALHRALGVSDDLVNAPRLKPIVRREKASGLREATPVILCSDWHVEEVVRPETVNGLNEFHPRIARQRVERLADAIAWEVALERHAFKLRDCLLWLGGDLITGYIHRELIEGNAMSPTQATLFAQELCELVIARLLALGFERIVVVCDHGNHGRTTEKKQISTGAFNSLEWLMYHSLKRRYADEKRVEFMISDGNMSYSKIYGFVLRTTHGDAIKYGGGIGGITVPVIKKVQAWNKSIRADETAFGHFHTLLTLTGINGNGSLIGYAPFAQWIGAEPERPQQGFFLMDSRRGKVHPKALFCTASKERA